MALQDYFDQKLREIAPIDGVSFVNPKDPKTWRVDFKPEATEEQKAAVNLILQTVPVEYYIEQTQYVEQRRVEYPAIEQQLDTLYHHGLDAWRASIKAIKDKYPKPANADVPLHELLPEIPEGFPYPTIGQVGASQDPFSSDDQPQNS